MPKRTVENMLVEIDELKQRAAVKNALCAYLRMRYLSCDGVDAQGRIAYDRSTVTEDVIEGIAKELETEVSDIRKDVEIFLKETINVK
jgi:hypothetical protein